MKDLKLEITYMPLEQLTPYKNNAKLHPQEQIDEIKASIIEFGMNDPIAVCGPENIIIEGHGRLIACQQLGIETVPVIRLDHLTEDQRKAYTLAHNKLTMNTDFDLDMLKMELQDIDLDMGDFGFSVELEELDLHDNDEIVEDEVPEPPVEPKAKLGDIYQLGEHRLMCGDSTDAGSVAILMDGQKADMVFTDPPYNMDYSGASFINDTNNNVKNRIKNIIDFDPMGISYLSNMEVGSVYIFTSKDLIKSYLDIFKDWHFNLLIWEKTNTPPMVNNNFFADIEYLLYFHRGKRIWNNGLTPIDIYKKFYISPMGQGKMDAGADLHPTMKPIKFISDKIKISSKENGVILDLFGGSGSTLIACEQLGRRCYMMELDPHYVDVIIERWEKLTGNKAEKIN